MRKRILFLVFIGWLIVTTNAMAATIRYDITGTVNTVHDYGTYLYGLEIGDSVTGYFSYDDEELVPIDNGRIAIQDSTFSNLYPDGTLRPGFSTRLVLNIGDSIQLNIGNFADNGFSLDVFFTDGLFSHLDGVGDEQVWDDIPAEIIPEEYRTEDIIYRGYESYIGYYSLTSDSLSEFHGSACWGDLAGYTGPTWEASISYSQHAVPEPTTLALLFGGLFGITCFRRKMR